MLTYHAGHFKAFSLLGCERKGSMLFVLPRVCGDEERFGVLRENFIQPGVFHVPPREFPVLCQGSES